jgi:hypothetical protein
MMKWNSGISKTDSARNVMRNGLTAFVCPKVDAPGGTSNGPLREIRRKRLRHIDASNAAAALNLLT